MAEDKERLELKSLPSVESLEAGLRKKVMELMEALETVAAKRVEWAIKEDELKDELERLQKEAGRTGFRHGWLVFAAQPVAGRKTLDKMLLLENGCPASVLNDSYKEGKPSTRCTFRRLEEEG